MNLITICTYIVYFFIPLQLAFANEIQTLTQETMKEWDIPGLALSIVHEGKPIHTKGYGVKRRGEIETVNEETLFQISSLTKAFTALSISLLVEEGLLDWKKPISFYLPNFQLKDPIASQQTTLDDLLCHKTGLPNNGDMHWWRLWWLFSGSKTTLMNRLAFLEPFHPFRTHFGYNNLGYVAASQVIEKMTKMNWENVCLEKILKKVGMNRSHFSYKLLCQDSNAAAAHLNASIQEKPIAWRDWTSMSGAAGMNSCAKDMSSWLRFCLLGNPAFLSTIKARCLLDSDGLLDDFAKISWPLFSHLQPIVHYGYGWMMYSLEKRSVFFHIGSSDGMQAIIAIIPQENLGIAILTNQSFHLGHVCLMNSLIDKFLNLKKTSWNALAKKITQDANKAIKDKVDKLLSARQKIAPTFNIQEYEGLYFHPAYGTLIINKKGEDLFVSPLNEKTSFNLNHWEENRFQIKDPSFCIPWIIDFQLTQNKASIEGFIMPQVGFFQKILK